MNRTQCPYNPNHTFAEEKYFWHINRCKDKLKVGHLYSTCSFNKLHIVLKQDIETHQVICEDRESMMQARKSLGEIMKKCFHAREQEKIKKKQQESCLKEEQTVRFPQGNGEHEHFQNQQKDGVMELKKEEELEENRNEDDAEKQEGFVVIEECEFCREYIEILGQKPKVGLACVDGLKKLQKLLKAYHKICAL